MTDTSCFAFTQQEIEHAIVEESGPQAIDTTATDTMEQIVVDIVDTQLAKRLFIHLFGRIEVPTTLSLGRQLCGHIILIARIAAQGASRLALVTASFIHWGRIEIVHTVGNGIVYQLIDFILIIGQSHHAKAKQ